MQIHIDSKCKFALDDITLWANRCTKNVNGNYHFTFSFGSALCKWGEFFTGNYIL